MSTEETGSTPGRRAVLRGLFAVGASAVVTGCGTGGSGAGDGSQSSPPDPAAPPSPRRTVDPAAPVSRLVTLSSADLDVVHALGLPVAAAWAEDGTGPRPWRTAPSPTAIVYEGVGAPTLRALLPSAPGALVVAGAELSRDQLAAYEQLAPVVCGDSCFPHWADHLRLVAEAAGRDPADAIEVTSTALDAWTVARRRDGATAIAVVLGTGATPDTPVATLRAESPLGRQLTALGFEVVAHDEAVSFGSLGRRGVLVVRADPTVDDVVAAVRQPSTLSLPWLLERLARGRRPAR